MIKLNDGNRIKYKVTKRIIDYYVAETKVFDSKKDALEQFNEWLM